MTDTTLAATPVAKPISPAREVWLSLKANKGALAGLVVIVVLVLAAILADVIAPYHYAEVFKECVIKQCPPVWQEGSDSRFLLGTDAVGRDLLSRIIYGSRYSLFIGTIVVTISLAAGILFGLLSGFFRGTVDILIMRAMDIILSIPSLLLALAIVAILGSGLLNAMIAVAITYMPHYARLARAAVLTELPKDYVTASRVAGAGTLRLMLNTVLPNCLAPLIVQATLSFSTAILDAAALGFLGYGAQAPTPEWGTMLADARTLIRSMPWVVTLPGPRHPHHGAGLQPAGRRAARCARPEAEALTAMALLEIRNLAVEFQTHRGPFRAVDGIDLTLEPGELLGVVGESGSGKSVTMLAVMGLIAWPGKVTADVMRFDGIDLLSLSDRERRKIVGKDIAMIFQEPMTSLNPSFSVGYQIMETLAVHEGGSRSERRRRTIELLEQVGIPAAATRLDSFPHQLSGGMCQRVMIAMAIACNPKLLIADEPTTALDVTIQAQILDLLVVAAAATATWRWSSSPMTWAWWRRPRSA